MSVSWLLQPEFSFVSTDRLLLAEGVFFIFYFVFLLVLPIFIPASVYLLLIWLTINNSSIWHMDIFSKTWQQSRQGALRPSEVINFDLSNLSMVRDIPHDMLCSSNPLIAKKWTLRLGDFSAGIFPSCKKKKTLGPVIPGKGQLCKSWCVGLMRLLCNNVEEVLPSAKETWGNWESEHSKILFCMVCNSVL